MPESTEQPGVRADLPDWALSPQERASRAAQTGRPLSIDIGRVISRAFSAIGANFGPFFFLAMLFAAAPMLAFGFGIEFLLPVIASGTGSSFTLIASLLPLISVLVMAIPSYILVGALTHGSIAYYNGGRASFGECLGTGWRFLLPLLGLGLLSVLGLMLWALPIVFGLGVFGAMIGGSGAFSPLGPLLVFPVMLGLSIPLIMALIRWTVAAPSLVVERLGVMDAFRRSIDLTRGNRWRIFWLAVIYYVVSGLIQNVFTFLTSSVATSASDAGLTLTWLSYGATVLYASFNLMIAAAGSAVLYFELRVTKE